MTAPFNVMQSNLTMRMYGLETYCKIQLTHRERGKELKLEVLTSTEHYKFVFFGPVLLHYIILHRLLFALEIAFVLRNTSGNKQHKSIFIA